MNRHADIIATLLTWIDENIRHSITINDVAERSGYSKWYLQRIFKKVTHQKLATYIRRRKLAHAARDLNETQLSVGIISDRYGFENQQTFTRSFTREYKLPPATYRRNKRFVKASHSDSNVILR